MLIANVGLPEATLALSLNVRCWKILIRRSNHNPPKTRRPSPPILRSLLSTCTATYITTTGHLSPPKSSIIPLAYSAPTKKITHQLQSPNLIHQPESYHPSLVCRYKTWTSSRLSSRLPYSEREDRPFNICRLSCSHLLCCTRRLHTTDQSLLHPARHRSS